ncbi:hypothetical protein [Cellulosimicrobium marinum]|uniref:hypothetical protein n=1 Tax=Cellulosimicrobium marinum TaxID=1638992 RepID=UPI001E3E21CB|nr:hypothetical protein [Cellulosimicrobium marinum]MCB7137897.1 hypothetical protein [Cellulosimicrobium marinum]
MTDTPPSADEPHDSRASAPPTSTTASTAMTSTAFPLVLGLALGAAAWSVLDLTSSVALGYALGGLGLLLVLVGTGRLASRIDFLYERAGGR